MRGLLSPTMLLAAVAAMVAVTALSTVPRDGHAATNAPTPGTFATIPPSSVASSFLSKLNTARKNRNIPTVSWDSTFAYDLADYINHQLSNDSWFYFQDEMYAKYQKPMQSWIQTGHSNWNGYYLMLKDGLAASYPDYTFFIHDTCASSTPATCYHDVLYNYRLDQFGCFDATHCNTTAYNNFQSCASATAIQDIQNPGAPNPWPGPRASDACATWFMYAPRFLYREMTKFACAELRYPGPATPSGQLYSFWCYGDLKVNGVPWVFQDRGSDLPY